MEAGTDRIGRTILECSVCGPQTVTVVGEHKYDQFERHKDELAQLISRGKTQVSKRVPAECGDAFRQETHKKGAALNGTAWGLDLMVDF